MINISTVIETTKIEKTWVVYIIFCQETAKVVFVGCCKLTQLFGLPDARQFVTDLPANIIIRVTDQFDNKAAALQQHAVRVRETGLVNELAIQRFKAKGGAIECVTTGETWRTIAECAAAHGLAPGNLSNHLRGVSSFKTVKGKIYRRVPFDPAKHVK